MTRAVYNEIEPFACDWLENLVKAGHVASGRVERRSIRELMPDDVRDATQAHFFAGIAVWSAALRAAGWPDDVPIWTGSCPCQPFSQAGSGKGIEDERHLWPEWYRLIRELRPAVIVGEQVASPAGLEWLDAVFADLESAGYACAAIDFGAASVGAPHIRQRLYFVALADRERLQGIRVRLLAGRSQQAGAQAIAGWKPRRGLADTGDGGNEARVEPRRLRDAGELGDNNDSMRGALGGILDGENTAPVGSARGLGDPGLDGDFEHAGIVSGDESQHEIGTEDGDHAPVAAGTARGACNGFWNPCDWIACTDGVSRPVEPGTFPLAHGATARVGRLRAYGNAIVRPQAQAFLETVIDLLING